MTRRPGWRLAGAALLVALAAAGYGDDGEEDSVDTGSGGPLAEFFGWAETGPESQAPSTPGAADDPNLAYRESLPPAAQQEYDRALLGGEAGETGGCQNQAYEQVYDDRTEGERRFDALVEEWDTLYQRIESDPRDHTCRLDHDVDGIERTVRFGHGARFIEEHRADLEAYRDWLNEQGIAG